MTAKLFQQPDHFRAGRLERLRQPASDVSGHLDRKGAVRMDSEVTVMVDPLHSADSVSRLSAGAHGQTGSTGSDDQNLRTPTPTHRAGRAYPPQGVPPEGSWRVRSEVFGGLAG